MKFEINRLEMLAAAKCAKKVAPTGSPVETLNGILVECDEDKAEVVLTATNHDTSIQCNVKASVSESGTMLVNAEKLVDILTLLSCEYTDFSVAKPGVIRIAGGGAVYTLYCVSAKHYSKPEMPLPEETVKLKGLCSLYKKTAFAASKDRNHGARQSVTLKTKGGVLHASACDGMKMMFVKGTAESTNTAEFLLPADLFGQLASISSDEDVYEVGIAGHMTVFSKENMLFSMGKLEGTPIDPMTVLKSIKPKYTAAVDVRKLRDTLDTASVGAGKQPIKLRLSDERVYVTCDGDHGLYASSVPALINGDIMEDGFFYNCNWLLKALSAFNGKAKLEFDATGYLTIKSLNEIYLQLPIQKQVKTEKPAKEAA